MKNYKVGFENGSANSRKSYSNIELFLEKMARKYEFESPVHFIEQYKEQPVTKLYEDLDKHKTYFDWTQSENFAITIIDRFNRNFTPLANEKDDVLTEKMQPYEFETYKSLAENFARDIINEYPTAKEHEESQKAFQAEVELNQYYPQVLPQISAKAQTKFANDQVEYYVEVQEDMKVQSTYYMPENNGKIEGWYVHNESENTVTTQKELYETLCFLGEISKDVSYDQFLILQMEDLDEYGMEELGLVEKQIPESSIQMEITKEPKVTVYSENNSPYCIGVKNILGRKRIPFNEINVSLHPEYKEILRKKGYQSTPVTEIEMLKEKTVYIEGYNPQELLSSLGQAGFGLTPFAEKIQAMKVEDILEAVNLSQGVRTEKGMHR